MNTLAATLCTLEPQVEAHAAEMFSVLCDPAIYEFEGAPPPSLERLAAGYRRGESRLSPDGREHLLNWVVRLPSGELSGYVQAAVSADGRCHVGYEFASRFWRKGIATSALRAVMSELTARYGVRELFAVLKAANSRSLGLLRKLGFIEVPAHEQARFEPGDGETVMIAAVVRHMASSPSLHAKCASPLRGLPQAGELQRWEPLRSDGTAMRKWRQTYQLLRTPEGIRFVVSTTHAPLLQASGHSGDA